MTAQAAELEGRGLEELGATLGQVAEYMDRRADQQAVSEYNEQLLYAQAEATKALGLLDGPSMAVDTPGMESLEFERTVTIPDPSGGTKTIPRDAVPTYEVGGPWLAQRMTSIRDSALSNLKDARSKKKFASEWALIDAKATSSNASNMRELFIADKRGGYELNREQFVQLGDEENARALAFQAFASRIITADQLASDLETIGQDIDLGYYGQRIAVADDAPDLDMLIEQSEAGVILDAQGEPRKARLTPDQLWTVRQRANTKRQQLDKARDEVHRAGAVEGTTRFMDGSLTVGWLREQVAIDKLSHTQALNFEQKLHTRATSTTTSTNPEALNSFRVKIRNLRWQSGGAGRVSQRYTELRDELYLAANGITPDGYSVRPQLSISGKDYNTLMGELDSERGRIDDDPTYKQAVDSIRSTTGVVPGLDFGLEGNAGRLLAYDAAKRGLDDYIDRYGAEAKPLDWVRDNRELFDPQKYGAENLREFAELRGSTLTRYLPPAVAAATKDWSRGQEWPVTAPMYSAAIYDALRAGDLTYEGAMLLYDQLNGITLPIPAGTMESIK